MLLDVARIEDLDRFLAERRGSLAVPRPADHVSQRVETVAEGQRLRRPPRAKDLDCLRQQRLGLAVASGFGEDAGDLEAQLCEIAGDPPGARVRGEQREAGVALRLGEPTSVRLDQRLPGEIDGHLQVVGAKPLAMNGQRLGDGLQGLLGVASVEAGPSQQAQPGRQARRAASPSTRRCRPTTSSVMTTAPRRSGRVPGGRTPGCIAHSACADDRAPSVSLRARRVTGACSARRLGEPGELPVDDGQAFPHAGGLLRSHRPLSPRRSASACLSKASAPARSLAIAHDAARCPTTAPPPAGCARRRFSRWIASASS